MGKRERRQGTSVLTAKTAERVPGAKAYGARSAKDREKVLAGCDRQVRTNGELSWINSKAYLRVRDNEDAFDLLCFL